MLNSSRRLLIAIGIALGAVVPVLTWQAHAEDALPVTYSFTGGVLAASAEGDVSPPGANDWSCRPTQRHPRPVVLVHGTFANRNNNWRTYAPLLANERYCVYAFTYGLVPETDLVKVGGMAPMQDSARQLARFIAKVRATTGAAKVDLIGHSQGTLMPNYYVKFLGGARFVKNYISLASLWHGTRAGTPFRLLASLLGADDFTEAPICKACAQMATGSDFIQKMRRGGVAVPGVSYTNIVTKYDELIAPYASGIESGMRNIVIQDHCALDLSDHAEITADPVAARVVLNTLDPGHRRPVPCMLVLPLTGPVTG